MGHSLQIERVLDEINHKGTSKYFDSRDVEGKKREVVKAIKTFSKTGKFDFNPSIKEEDYSSDGEFQDAYQREKTINATDFVVEPR